MGGDEGSQHVRLVLVRVGRSHKKKGGGTKNLKKETFDDIWEGWTLERR